MTIFIDARFENGVFVPDTKVDLQEHQRVQLAVDPVPLPWQDDPNDPRPAGGLELVQWRARHRLKVDPEIVREIMSDPEFDIENS